MARLACLAGENRGSTHPSQPLLAMEEGEQPELVPMFAQSGWLYGKTCIQGLRREDWL